MPIVVVSVSLIGCLYFLMPSRIFALLYFYAEPQTIMPTSKRYTISAWLIPSAKSPKVPTTHTLRSAIRLLPISKTLIAACLVVLLIAGCSTTDQQPRTTMVMDKVTELHPATKQFLLFADAAKTTNNANDLKDQFYTPFAAEQLINQKGWYRLVYSANHYILKGMECEKLELTRTGSESVRFDCTGIYNAWSPILGNTIERAHLRTNMKEIGGEWLFDKSGYVHTQTFEDTVSKRRGGIKFNEKI